MQPEGKGDLKQSVYENQLEEEESLEAGCISGWRLSRNRRVFKVNWSGQVLPTSKMWLDSTGSVGKQECWVILCLLQARPKSSGVMVNVVVPPILT